MRIQNAGPSEWIELDAIPGALDVTMPDLATLVLKNAGDATALDFLLALQLVHYNDLSPTPVRGLRVIECRVFTDCGEIAVRYAYLPLFPPPDAGTDGDTLVCAGSPPFDLSEILEGSPTPGGFWSPRPVSGSGLFDPAKDPPGRYLYFFPKAGECPGDTAVVTVRTEQPFQLRPDTTLCFDDTLTVYLPPGVTEWQWNNGSRLDELPVTAPGTYTLTGETENCTFTDSVHIEFYTCKECPHYAPNVFSPNDDGENDEWQIFLPCNWLQYRLEIYDRWGGLVFSAVDPAMGWDGFANGKAPIPGVYVWSLEWTGELLGETRVFRAEGDVTVLR